MRKSIFSLLILLFCSCSKQRDLQKEVNYIPYYLKVYEADSLYINGEYLKSYNVLNELFKKYKPINMPIYYEYARYLSLSYKVNKQEKICEKLKTLIENYGYTEDRIKNSEELNKIYENCENVKNEIDNIYNKYLSKINLELRDKILEMTENDQKYRSKGIYKQNIDKQNEIDVKNANDLMKIFDKYGYPNENIIGNNFIDNKHTNVGVILLHTKDSIRVNYFIPKLLEYVKLGQCNPKIYARIVDQLKIYNGEYQVYGTYSNQTVSTKNMDSLRKTIGLPNINYEKKRLKILYPNLNKTMFN